MKKIICVLVSLCLIILLAGCGENAEPSSLVDSSSTISDDEKKPFEGVKVTCMTYQDPELSRPPEQARQAAKEHGIDFEFIIHPQGEIAKELAASIASGTQPDICYVYYDFCSIYPLLQPLDSTGLDLNEAFLDHSILEASAINGKAYLANGYGNPYSYISLCFYNKELFEQADIPTPKEFYEKGEWTLDNFKFCAEKISALGKEYIGAGVLSESTAAIVGNSYFSFKNGKIFTDIPDRYYEVISAFSEMKKRNVIKLDRGGFQEGKQGMALSDSYGLFRTGYFQGMNFDAGVTLMPKLKADDKHIISAPFGGWGIVKGAKNPEAAGLWLKSYLHPEIDSTEIENEEFKDFYFGLLKDKQVDIEYFVDPENLLFDQDLNKQNSDEFISWNDTETDNIEEHLKAQTELFNELASKANEQLTLDS